MRFLAALRGRDRGYSSLAHLNQPVNSSDEVPRREVERIPLNERPVLSSPSMSGTIPCDRMQTDAGAMSPGVPSQLSVETENMGYHPLRLGETSENLEIDFDRILIDQQSFLSEPPPPPHLWDTDDVQYLDKVMCRCWVRLIHIDPKNGAFEGQMKCHWAFRTLNIKDRTEPRIRVPGIRLPKLLSIVDESRIWRDFPGDGENTIAWLGTSVLQFKGSEIFDVHDFPFDRQVVNLNLFECVWREDKDTDMYYETMKLVSLTVQTSSMLPEWHPFPVVIAPCEVQRPGSGPTYGTRFVVKLRLQRREGYYVTHIFFVSLLIVVASLFPMSFEPGETHIGDRLYIHTGGLMMLVVFKYSIGMMLPSVPYPTFMSTYLTAQVLTVAAASFEAVFSYVTVNVYFAKATLDYFEDFLLVALLAIWITYFGHIAFNMKRKPWDVVLREQGLDDCGGIDIQPPSGYFVAPM